jgi:SAM-dependent methyltransferase
VKPFPSLDLPLRKRVEWSHMTLYARQKKYFEAAYAAGVHGWPVSGPTPFVVSTVKRLIREKKLFPGSRVLDIGCGEGRHTFACAALGLEAFGLDYQKSALDRARSMPDAGKFRRGFHFASGDVFQLPFAAGSFELLIDYGCLHHVRKRDTARYLEGVTRMLGPGGWFILSCFSWRFKHHPDERRTRDWLVHRDHYDRFFRKGDFQEIFDGPFKIEKVEEERDGIQAFYHVLMQKQRRGEGVRHA